MWPAGHAASLNVIINTASIDLEHLRDYCATVCRVCADRWGPARVKSEALPVPTPPSGAGPLGRH